MAKYSEIFKLLKSTNFNASDAEIESVMGTPKKNYDMGELGAFAKTLAAKSAKKNLFFEKKTEECTLKKSAGRMGVSFEDLYAWLEKLTKEQNYVIDREKVKKLLRSSAYRALRLDEEGEFFNPAIRACAQQILREN